ncbi:MAG: hypothetical protein C6I01_05600 [Epsilonproteobacteria bacterium]|nr:hypothetical protein [Campylobacterota bacterium]
MARKKKENINFHVQKPPSDIVFVPPDSILEPYPEEIRINDPYFDIVKKRFKEYILNGIAWANKQREAGNPYARFPSEALCVNNLRLKVKEWREEGYPGTTETTRYLLRFWFEYPREKPFWFSQREAIETLIYLYEVEKIIKVTDLIQRFGAFNLTGYEDYNRYPRYAFRMATGSGKTLSMALISVWSFFNYLYEDRERFTRFFLFVAPNIIVYDRLRKDFETLSIYDEFQVIPEEWKKDFQLQVITRDTFSDSDRFPPPEDVGAIFVSNIHQIGMKKGGRKKQQDDLIGGLFGLPDPGKDPYKASSVKLWDILISYPNIMILKDEAHHIHNEQKSWQKYLWELNDELLFRHGKGIFMELDFSATPKNEKGELFPWIIVDFSLREALQTGIVKYPAKVVLEYSPKIKRGFSLVEYEPYIEAALDRWRKHKEKLKELGKKSVLFVMTHDISSAGELYERLLNEDDINGSNMLLIHSELDSWKTVAKEKNKSFTSKIVINGEEREIGKELAVELVRNLDEPDNPIEVVVSVMMLNEGWDVRSVTIILGLRSYSSKREVLPEQVIGRGLRKLFPNQGVDVDKWINILEVVGPPNLLKVIDNLETLEGIKIPEAPKDFFISFNPRTEAPKDMLFEIPMAEFISFTEEVNVDEVLKKAFEGLPKDKELPTPYNEQESHSKVFDYQVIDLKGRKLDEGEVEASVSHSPWYEFYELVRSLQDEIPLPNSFNKLSAQLLNYISEHLFNTKVEVDDEILSFLVRTGYLQQMRRNLLNEFKALLRNPLTQPNVSISGWKSIKDVSGFPWNKEFMDSDKSLFVRITHDEGQEIRIPSVPVDNEMEVNFVNFLSRAKDVVSFIKNIPYSVGLGITYYDSRERKWRRFYPDFIVKTTDGMYIVETKGREEIQIKDKNVAAQKWCEAVSNATGIKWEYLYLREGDWAGKNLLGELKNET